MVTQEELDAALHAWEEAREGAVLEQTAWAPLLQSHASLIASLRANGHTWSQATDEFDRLSNAHSLALRAKWDDMDRLCSKYQRLRAAFAAH